MRFMMLLHGITLKKDENEESILIDQSNQTREKKIFGFMFQDPSMYEDMTLEEKEAETKKMMGMHKQWANAPRPDGKCRMSVLGVN